MERLKTHASLFIMALLMFSSLVCQCESVALFDSYYYQHMMPSLDNRPNTSPERDLQERAFLEQAIQRLEKEPAQISAASPTSKATKVQQLDDESLWAVLQMMDTHHPQTYNMLQQRGKKKKPSVV